MSLRLKEIEGTSVIKRGLPCLYSPFSFYFLILVALETFSSGAHISFILLMLKMKLCFAVFYFDTGVSRLLSEPLLKFTTAKMANTIDFP